MCWNGPPKKRPGSISISGRALPKCQVDGTHLREAGTRICASYINYYAGNSAIVVPLFGDRHDAVAQATLAELFPGHRIIGIENSREILLGGGNVACITMPQYAGGR